MRLDKLIGTFVVFLICCFYFSNATANTNLSLDSHNIYEVTGDVSGIDNELYYFEAKEKILLIAGDITIPIPFKDAESFLVLSDGTIVEWLSIVSDSELTAISSQVLMGDFNGDSRTDLFLKSQTPSLDSLIVFGDAGKVPASSSLVDTVEGFDIYDKTIEVSDFNGDGKDDLKIKAEDGAEVVSLALEGGRFNQYRGGISPGTVVPGAIAGDFSVGKDGSASYTIPIAVAPGGAGMQPNLAFSYSSSSGNGYMGMGWSVSQPSAISRCNSTFIDDGYIQADKYFCLDGQRMVETQPGTYMLQNTNFTKIEKISGKDAFKVFYKSGEIAYFGNFNGNRSDAYDLNSDLRHLAKIEDRAQNARTYHYYKNTSSGEHFLDEIRYPGGSVDFVYSKLSDPRSDSIESWHKGKRTQIIRTLDKVITHAPGGVYRTYGLGYKASTNGKTLLDSVQECGADETCLSPSTIAWSALASTESPRVYRRLTFLRELAYEQETWIFPRSA